LLTLVVNAHARAQSEYLFWTMSVRGGEVLLPQPRTFALYGPTTELTLTLRANNEGPAALLLDPGALVQGVSAALFQSGAQVPIEVEWDPAFQDSAQSATIPWVAGVEHLVQPEATLTWNIQLRPSNGSLSIGQYTVTIDMTRALQTALRRANGDQWLGRASQRTELTVYVRGNSAPADLVRAEHARGRLALAERRYSDALTAFLRAAAVSPPDAELSSNLGLAYLGTNAYPAAIKWLERAASMTPPDAHTALPELLALAYVGNGDEAAADKVLRSRGRSNSEVALEIQRLRGVVAQRGKK